MDKGKGVKKNIGEASKKVEVELVLEPMVVTMDEKEQDVFSERSYLLFFKCKPFLSRSKIVYKMLKAQSSRYILWVGYVH